jgi:plastocyanin
MRASPACLAIALFAFAGASAGLAQIVDVRIENFAYSPTPLTVDLNTTVRWTNFDFIEHTVTSQTGQGTLIPSGLFDSGDMPRLSTFSFTFDTPGTFYYYCIPHGSSMQGSVNVLPEPATITLLLLGAAALRRR